MTSLIDFYDAESDAERQKILKRWRRQAVKFTNKIRAAMGQEPLEDLVKGSVSVATACTISQSIVAPGLYASTGYQNVLVFDTEVADDRMCDNADHSPWELPGMGYLAYGSAHEHAVPTKKFKVPKAVNNFLSAFDDGEYEDLVL